MDETGDRAATAAIRSISGYRHEWPEAVRLRARELWAFECAEDSSAVAARLRVDEPQSFDVPERTIRHWALTEAWKTWASQAWAELAPGIRFDVAQKLIRRSVQAEETIGRILDKHKAGTEITKADDIAGKLALAVLDRTGHAPKPAATTGDSHPVKAIEAGDTPRTPEEALARLEAYKQTMRRKPG
jgi:hypothetical protein